VQGTSEMLAAWIGAPYPEVSYLVAGINHQAWFLKFEWNGRDVYPLLRERVKDPEVIAEEPTRIELMNHFGYFVTESSGHASEYVPYYRKNTEMVQQLRQRFQNRKSHWFRWGGTGGYLDYCKERLPTYLDEVKAQIAGQIQLPDQASHEYGAHIVRAMETGLPHVIHGNLPNSGLITNLPAGCCVEVPCLVDKNGVQPCYVGTLPPQLAALNRTNINVQELAVQGALSGDRELIYQAAMLDPLTGAVCTLPQIRAMMDELLAAEAEWLPQFQ
jgi:alpha-galactosidase